MIASPGYKNRQIYDFQLYGFLTHSTPLFVMKTCTPHISGYELGKLEPPLIVLLKYARRLGSQ
jgi:hypothetical protein